MSDNQGCIGFLAALFGSRARQVPAPTYRVRDDFLSPAELSYYRVLTTAVSGRAVVLTKVRLADLFFVPRGDGSTGARNRIAQKHVDFLLCDRDTMRPLVAVELDDRSHERESRQERDRVVDEVFGAAGLPLLHVPAKSAYSVAQTVSALAPYLGDSETDRSEQDLEEPVQRVLDAVDGDAPPTCPKCGVPMVLRTAGRGARRGEQFYGCPNYPRCRQTGEHGGAEA